VASHESDQVEIPPNHQRNEGIANKSSKKVAMEDANWVHEGLGWKCMINGCIDTYVVKWLFH